MPRRVTVTAFLLAALLVALAAGRGTSQPSEPSAALMAEAQARGTARVLVRLATPFVAEDALPTGAHVMMQRQEIARFRVLVRAGLRGIPHRILREYDALPFVSVEVGPDALRMLAALRGVVAHVQKDELAAPALAESVPLIQGDLAQGLGYDGTGQIVAILDGVDKNHPFLAGRVIAEACFSSTVPADNSSSLCPGGATSSTDPGSALPCNVSGCDHGTNVAGIAAGSDALTSGVAPGAKIVAIQIFSRIDDAFTCNPDPSCVRSYQSDQLAALNHVHAIRNNFPGLSVAAVNLTVAGITGFSAPCDTDTRKAAIDQLRAAGIATAVPGGNGGFLGSLTAPGCISTAISVGATRDGTTNVDPPATPADTVAAFSNTAPFLSLLAPGEWINSSVPGGGFVNFRGTSMATAHVVGALALLRQASPNATVDDMLQALQNSGVPITDMRTNPATVKPRIRIADAIASLLPSAPQITSLDPGHANANGPGLELTVMGQNFQESSVVRVNGADRATAFVDATQLTATVPAADLATAATSLPIVVATPGAGASNAAMLTVLQGEQAVQFSADTYLVSEKQKTVTITLKRTGPKAVTDQTEITVPVIVVPDTAVPAQDFVEPVGPVMVKFAKKKTTATFKLTLLNDTLVDGERLVDLILGIPQGAALMGAPDAAVVKIGNDDEGGVMKFAKLAYSVNEGGTLKVMVRRTGKNLASGVSVDYAVTGGTAVQGTDFNLPNGTLNFAARQSSLTLMIPTVRDFLVGPDKTIELGLSNPTGGGSVIAAPEASTTLTIKNIDRGGVIKLGAAAHTVNEAAGGSAIEVKVMRTGSKLAGGVSVRLRSVDMSATGGDDYGAVDQIVEFGPDEKLKTVVVPIFDDGTAEGAEQFSLVLDPPTGGATLGKPSTAVVTIKDDEALIQLAQTADQVLESQASKSFVVTRSGGFTPVSVHWSASTGESGTLDFGATQTSATIPVPIAAHFSNGTPDTARAFLITLDSPGGGAQLGANNPLTVSVLDDDVLFVAPAEPMASRGQPFDFSFCQPARTVGDLCGGPVATTNVNGGQPSYTFTKSGSLPTGLTLRPNGNVDGMPLAAPNRYKFTLCAVDLGGKKSCQPTSILLAGIDGSYTGAFSGGAAGAVAFKVTTTDGSSGSVKVTAPTSATGVVTGGAATFGALAVQGAACEWTGGFTINNATGAVHAEGDWNCVLPPNLGGGVLSGDWVADKPAPAV